MLLYIDSLTDYYERTNEIAYKGISFVFPSHVSGFKVEHYCTLHLWHKLETGSRYLEIQRLKNTLRVITAERPAILTYDTSPGVYTARQSGYAIREDNQHVKMLVYMHAPKRTGLSMLLQMIFFHDKDDVENLKQDIDAINVYPRLPSSTFVNTVLNGSIQSIMAVALNGKDRH